MEDQLNGGKSHSKHLYSLSNPYPVVRVKCENPYFASMLLDDYAGISGELTAINQYIYHCITLQDSHPTIAILARQVAITEMQHLEMIGKTIQLLGKLPIPQSSHNGISEFWSAKNVYYGQSVFDKLSANIKHEMDAISMYKSHLRRIDDPFIRELLKRIILDEEYHLWLFTNCRDDFCNSFYF